MATILNAGTTTGTSLAITPDTSGAMVIQTSGANAISISSSQAVTIPGTFAVTGTATFTGIPSGPTAAYGTNTTQFATTAFVQASVPAGVIVMWSGSIGTIPSGWLLCDGSSGTPDLRSKFIVGAGSTYAVNATGGSADAITVAHTHTYSGSTGTMSANASHSHGVSDPGHSHTFNLYAPNGGGGNPGGDLNTSAPTTYGTNASGTGIGINAADVNHTHTYSGTTASSGSSGTNANLPPYFALAYIMKA